MEETIRHQISVLKDSIAVRFVSKEESLFQGETLDFSASYYSVIKGGIIKKFQQKGN